MIELRYSKRLTMLLLQSVGPEVRLVDREAVTELVREAKKKGVSDEDLEQCQVEVTYRLVPFEEVVYPEMRSW